jgi:hypothetical protein
MVADVKGFLLELERAGRLRSCPQPQLDQMEKQLRKTVVCRSNDLHVIALALVSGARTLATDDKALTDDFTDARIIKSPRGSVYRTPIKHRHLLRHTPSSCGVGR